MPSSWTRGALLIAMATSAVACGPPKPRVHYQGDVAVRPPIPAESVEVLRDEKPSAPFKNLGTISVTCPSEAAATGFGRATMVGGCSYEHAVHLAAEKAAESGADGMHSIVDSTNSAGAVVSLRATAFYYVTKKAAPKPAAQEAPPPKTGAGPTVEERLKRLDKMKADGLITPEEYDAKRAKLLDEI